MGLTTGLGILEKKKSLALTGLRNPDRPSRSCTTYATSTIIGRYLVSKIVQSDCGTGPVLVY